MDRHYLESRQACGLKNDVIRSTQALAHSHELTIEREKRKRRRKNVQESPSVHILKCYATVCRRLLSRARQFQWHNTQSGWRGAEQVRDMENTHIHTRYNKTNGSRNRHGRWQFSKEVAKNALNPNVNQNRFGCMDSTLMTQWWLYNRFDGDVRSALALPVSLMACRPADLLSSRFFPLPFPQNANSFEAHKIKLYIAE